MNSIKHSFDQIQASPKLIEATKEKLSVCGSDAFQKSDRKKAAALQSLRPAIALLLAVLLLGGGIYQYQIRAKAVSYVSLDSSPSLELSLNQKDQILKVKACNEEAEAIVEKVKVKGKSCEDALEEILNCEEMKADLAENSELNLTLLCEDSKKCDQLEQKLANCESVKEHHAQTTVADCGIYEEAHEHQMSFGKYQYYLKLSQYDDSISAEDCQDLSVGELKEQITCHENEEEQHSSGECQEDASSGANSTHEHHREHHDDEREH